MTMQTTAHGGHGMSDRMKALSDDRRRCRRLVAAMMPIFLVTVAMERLVGNHRRGPGERRLSLYAEARAKAYAVIPFFFMG